MIQDEIRFRNKLIIYALISTPLLTLYGISPFFIFDIFTLNNSLKFFLIVSSNVIVYWIINAAIFFYVSFKNKHLPFILSYLFAFTSQIAKVLLLEPLVINLNLIENQEQIMETMNQFMIYPVITTVAMNTIIIIIISSLKREREKQKLDKKIAELNIQNLEAQKLALLGQLQPHFFFNAMSTLKSLINEDTEMAEEYSIKLSEFLRYSLGSHKNEIVTVSDEMEFVNNYLGLQKLRFGSSFVFMIEIPEDIAHLKVPVLSIQTLVENAFKHNFFTENKPLKLSIEYLPENRTIRVWNNTESSRENISSGTGLKNLNKRYGLISGKRLSIASKEDSFSVQIPILD